MDLLGTVTIKHNLEDELAQCDIVLEDEELSLRLEIKEESGYHIYAIGHDFRHVTIWLEKDK